MFFTPSDILLIVLTVSALVQAAWMIAVGRTLQHNGVSGAARVGVSLAGLCLCLLLPLYASAGVGRLGSSRAWLSLFDPEEFFLLMAISTAVLALGSSKGWGTWYPALIFVLGLLFTAIATAILWGLMTEMHPRLDGPAVVAGYIIVPCAFWHLITGPWLMRWAHVPELPVGRCLNCDYDLQGLPETTPCPECGAAHTRPDQIVEKDAPPGA